MKMLSVFFTDSELILVEKKKGLSPFTDYASAKIPEGYIVNGIIQKYDELVNFVENVLSRTDITAKHTNLLLHEKIITYKLYELPENIKERKITKFLEDKTKEDQSLPFSDPIIDYHVSYIKGIKEAIVFGASRKLVETYERLLDDVGLKLIATDMPALSSHRLFHLANNESDEADYMMFANVYDNIISINFFNRQYPEFNFVSDLEETIDEINVDDFVQIVQDEVYRMSNYYVWNLNKGKLRLDRAIIVPMTSKSEYNKRIKEVMQENNQSGVEDLYFFESIEAEETYDVDAKYLLTMSNTI